MTRLYAGAFLAPAEGYVEPADQHIDREISKLGQLRRDHFTKHLKTLKMLADLQYVTEASSQTLTRLVFTTLKDTLQDIYNPDR